MSCQLMYGFYLIQFNYLIPLWPANMDLRDIEMRDSARRLHRTQEDSDSGENVFTLRFVCVLSLCFVNNPIN